MWIRILTAVVALAVFVPILLFAPDWVILCLFGVLAAVAAYEIASCVGLKKNVLLTGGSMLLVYLIVTASIVWVMPTLAGEGLHEYATGSLVTSCVYIGALVLFFVLFVALAVAQHEQLPAEKIGLQGFFCLYVAYAFRSLGLLMTAKSNHMLLWVALCIPWVADTLAYFSGRFLGKRKLCPIISPKKTVAGAVGGVAGTGAVAVIVYGCRYNWEPVSLLVVFGIAAVLAVVSIFGDLFASVVKRRFGVKDYGKLFPGHGGVLDRFDSILPVAIVLYGIQSMIDGVGLL